MTEKNKVFLRLRNKMTHSQNKFAFNDKTFIFDGVLYANQEDIFNITGKDLAEDFVAGYNCTLLAYGQTGSGKTHTIQGTPNNEGVLQRIVSYIFNKQLESTVTISFLEIYNETIYDLFDFAKNKEIVIRDDPERGIYAENIKTIGINSYEDFLDNFEKGVTQRKTAETKMNIESSRSHSIFTLYQEKIKGNTIVRNKLHIIDLAGSERINNEYNEERQKECTNINKSILYLGMFIEQLSKNEIHANYRNSKLTHLLKDSLGGNAKLVVIGNIKNEMKRQENVNNSFSGTKKVKIDNFYEILNTLNFLERVMSIENKVNVNPEINMDINVLKMEYKLLYNKYIKLKTHRNKRKDIVPNQTATTVRLYLNKLIKMNESARMEYQVLNEKFTSYMNNIFEKRKEEMKYFEEHKRNDQT